MSGNGYILADYDFAAFSEDELVLDVGCGTGDYLTRLERRGARPFGIDVDLMALRTCRRNGHFVLQAFAEKLPVKTGSVGGILCKVVLPYTLESQVIREISRVLRDGGKANVCSHGTGYYLRYLLMSRSWKSRFYGFRTLVNTIVYRLSGKRLPGFLGDSIAQSRSRLSREFTRNNLTFTDLHSKRFLGFPVFLYQVVERSSRDVQK